MNIREIVIYSHSGQLRRISFNVKGLNIVTGCSSTGKSALADIVEYCMGRSTFNIPEGPIRDKVAWYAVIFQFSNEQVLVAKPAPAISAASCAKAMIRRGAEIEPPPFNELEPNADDDTVVDILSELLGIPSNKTEVSKDNSRNSFATNIKHCFYYLFQKQTLIANKEQLFYRQNEQFMPQAIKDTLPILLGIAPDDRLELENRLRIAKRDLKIAQKNLSDAEQFREQLNDRVISLLSESKQVGILDRSSNPESMDEAMNTLNDLVTWKPSPVPDEDTQRIIDLEDEIASLKKDRFTLNETLRATKVFSEKEAGFTSEAEEQKSRLESIYALPQNAETGEWQWPFAPESIDFKSPVAISLIQELESLDKELIAVAGERPHIEEFTTNLENQIDILNKRIKSTEETLAAAITANAVIAEMGNRNDAAAKTVGRISFFLETYRPDEDLTILTNRIKELQNKVKILEADIGTDDSAERLTSLLNIISSRINRYVIELGAEFSEYSFRFDFANLTVIADRPERPVPMNKTGGGANHLAYHLATLLSIHHFSTNNKKPIPSFLFLDQPTQVYFPSEQIYKDASGTFEDTERNTDIENVRKLFRMLYDFVNKESPDFQIIVIEHANLRDEWFQNSLIEKPWTKPPALVPDDWVEKKS